MISIIVPTFNRKELLNQHISFLVNELNDQKYELIIVNDSKTGKVELPFQQEYIHIFDNPKQGVASARNFGAKQAKYDWLLFMDDDMLINKENFQQFLTYCTSTDRKTVNLEWIYADETNLKLQETAFGRFLIQYGFNSLRGWNNIEKTENKEGFYSEGITSNNLLISKELFIESTGYNEDFPFAGAEDFEFSERLKRMGMKFYIDCTSQMIHNELDRLTIKNWMNRKYRDGITKRVAADLGYSDQFIPKRWYFSVGILIAPLVQFLYFFSNKFKSLDKLNFLCLKFKLGHAIHSGFYNKHYTK